MSTESLSQFRALVAGDEQLQSEVQSVCIGEGDAQLVPAEELVRLGAARGFHFSVDEIAAESPPLTDAQLEAVAGGAGYVKIAGMEGESDVKPSKEWDHLVSQTWVVRR